MNELATQVWAALLPVLATALVSILVALISAAREWVLSRIGSDRHAKAAGIILDSLLAATQRLGPQFAAMMADGKLSKLEQDAIKAEAKKIAIDRLSDLRGFIVAEAGEWIEVQLDAGLGKLIGGFGLQAGGAAETPTIQPNDPAV